MSLEILFEDNHLIAVNKPAGMLVQGDNTGDEPLVEIVRNYIKEKYNKPGNVFCGLIHRLDRPVSGIVLMARTSKALERMNRQFQERQVQKTYWAVVEKEPLNKKDRLINYLKKNHQQNKSYVFSSEKQGVKKAVLNYTWLTSSDRYHLLEVLPLTGRHHQIRVQLAAMGCIIKGDLKYGAKRSNRDASIHLHALKLNFIHPVKKEPIQVVSKPPNSDELWTFFIKKRGL